MAKRLIDLYRVDKNKASSLAWKSRDAMVFKAKSRSTQICYQDPAVMGRPALLRVVDVFEQTESSDSQLISCEGCKLPYAKCLEACYN